jgi:DNA-binding beta-propeller fold protein YncE
MLMLRRVLVVLVGVLVLGALGAGSAFGGLSYPFDGELAPAGGSSLEAGSVAVDDSNGHTYVADSRSGAVDVFETALGSQLAGLDGSLTPVGSFGGGQVEVAANNGTGDVYVLDSTDNVVDVFGSAGGYVCQITGSATPSASECNGVAGSDTPAHGFSRPGGIAVDEATGEVYVVDAYNGVVDVFSSAGAYVRQVSLGSIPGGFNAVYTRGIAVDDFNGDVFVSDSGSPNPVGENVVYVFNAAGVYQTTWTGIPGQPFGNSYVSVAADNANGYVFVTAHGATDVFKPSGAYVTQFSYSFFGEPQGTAVGQASGRVYVSKGGVVDIFGPGTILPDVSTAAASNVLVTSATLHGTVNPDGVQLSDCHFEYGTSTAYGQSAPCAPAAAAIPADSSEHAVSADIIGLQAGTTYHFRLVAANARDVSGPGVGVDATFETLPLPGIDGAEAINLTGSAADLTVRINPNGLDTSYRIEYGTSTAYGTSVPVPDGHIAAGAALTVTEHIAGLQANTTYHWRVVAQNANGTTTGEEHTFIYDTTGEGLPDKRAYEMVTPPQKNGALIGDVFLGHGPDISDDGSRVFLTTIACFAGTGACNANRGSQGTPVAFTRTSGGWMASGLMPPASQFDVATSLRYSATAGSVLFSVPTSSGGGDVMLARGPDGSFAAVGPVTSPSLGQLENPGQAVEPVTSADISHVVYILSGTVRWPFDADRTAGSPYEYVGTGNSAPVLVGVSGGAGSTDLISTCETLLGGGPGVSHFYNSLSADGDTVFFTALACTSGSGVNASVPVPAETLYARIGESRTVLISGRSPLGCTTPACLGSSPRDAEFAGASTDGSRVFFTSTQRLTDAASEGSKNLYEYDFSRPAGENLVAVSAGDTSGGGPGVTGVEAISSDGSHVYFAAKGVLTGAANSQGQVAQAGAENLYVIEHDAADPGGRAAFIAVLPPSDSQLEVHRVLHGNSSAPGFVGGVGGANVTPDGQFLVFMSHGRLTPDDTSTSGTEQVFRYDAQTGALVRISIGERGFNDNGNTGSGNATIVPAEVTFERAGGPRPDPTMSHDGAFVFFESPVGLTPRALNDVQVAIFGHPEYAENVYEWHEGHVHLISDGRDTSALAPGFGHPPVSAGLSAVELIGSDATGANVFFTTADRLVAQDTDTQLDFYDARICTQGDPCVAGPSAAAAGCVGEECRGVPGTPPSLAGPASASFSGVGNLAMEAKSVAKAKKAKRRKARKKRRKGKRVVGKRGKARGSVRSTWRGR